MSHVPTPDRHDDELARLRAEARHARQKRDLYRQKAYSGRETTPARMRELEHQLELAEERLRTVEREHGRA